MTDPIFDWPEKWNVLRRNDSRLITVFGKLVIDQIHTLEKTLIMNGQTRTTPDERAGGAPANVTSELSRHQMRSRFAGWVGVDSTAQQMVSALRARGIDFQVKFQGRSPLAVVMVNPDGGRTLLTGDGEGTLTPADLSPLWFQNSAAVHLDGYDLLEERFPAAVIAAAQQAHQAGALVTMDMGASNRIASHGPDAYADLIRDVRPHVIFSNKDEAEVLNLTERQFNWGPIIAVHRGGDPTLIMHQGRSFEVPVSRLKVVDSTGCGDAFAAGFLAGWTDGVSLRTAVDRAHAWAGEVAMVLGGHVEADVVPFGMQLR